jgi:hypothetical protein
MTKAAEPAASVAIGTAIAQLRLLGISAPQIETGRRRDMTFRARRRIFSGLSAAQSAAVARPPLPVARAVRSTPALHVIASSELRTGRCTIAAVKAVWSVVMRWPHAKAAQSQLARSWAVHVKFPQPWGLGKLEWVVLRVTSVIAWPT